MSILNEPLSLGSLEIPNRIIMAPLTRSRAVDQVPTALMAEYYRQRAGAGLIISEATAVTPMGVGYRDTPGIWSDEQAEAWEPVVRAVHDAGGRIALQLWHVGRISHPDLLGGMTPVAPSAVLPAGRVRRLRPMRGYVTPREMTLDEINATVADYGAATARARAIGFDGVEIHAANGYLIDQFLQDSTNRRTDAYGGPMSNRERFLLEVVGACSDAWEPGRVGVHLAPRADEHDMGDSDLAGLFTHVAGSLAGKVGYLCVREHEAEDSVVGAIKEAFGVPVIGNERMSAADAQRLIEADTVDAVAFGKAYIANPDLAERVLAADARGGVGAGAADASGDGWPRRVGSVELNELVTDTIYPPYENPHAHLERGYTDYPAAQL
ncbi:alkene reductase [Corynebacterium sp. MSK006]|uniref:alkene reductase n=1 Tax=Corynebacterium sp. MSK006 TaxID=3050187 RepID=UPI00254DB750|nr:alkene reductase [Corynebacterium sp. MSK006]MDK8894797.1 alkene reductase [Corynebacterium sp. MSK006]